MTPAGFPWRTGINRNHPPGATGVTAGSTAPGAWQPTTAITRPARAAAHAGVSNGSTPGGGGTGGSWQRAGPGGRNGPDRNGTRTRVPEKEAGSETRTSTGKVL
ncbi:hypothetical protein GCM10010109_59370 [Actinoplanes campanulatus]|nr:hypothetical protein GCM10010109_59370 [Actinoplanes campanulatus]GID39161.1 hypothetical protein Aca09nite_56670 [Actinoplanes campanulatus]